MLAVHLCFQKLIIRCHHLNLPETKIYSPKTFHRKGLQISISFHVKIIDYIDVLFYLNDGAYLLFVNLMLKQPTSRKIIKISSTNPFLLQLTFESHCFHNHY